jgi:hypothetical protein
VTIDGETTHGRSGSWAPPGGFEAMAGGFGRTGDDFQKKTLPKSGANTALGGSQYQATSSAGGIDSPPCMAILDQAICDSLTRSDILVSGAKTSACDIFSASFTGFPESYLYGRALSTELHLFVKSYFSSLSGDRDYGWNCFAGVH